jgi:hypothetical protein
MQIHLRGVFSAFDRIVLASGAPVLITHGVAEAVSRCCADRMPAPAAVLGVALTVVHHGIANGASAGALERQRQVQVPSSIVCTTVVEPVCARDKTGTLRDYNNACEAERDGAIVIRKGRCAQSQ